MSVIDNINQTADIISSLKDTAAYNSAQSAEQARIQREWQEQQNAKAMEFNRVEAEKTRNWQQIMSNTAHQREIADLKAAGLNPVLSAMGGNGAAVTSGATASGVSSSGAKGDVDTSVNSALVNLLGSVYNRTTQLEAANINARTQEAIADKYTQMNQLLKQMDISNQRYMAQHFPTTEIGALSALINSIPEMTSGKSVSNSVNDVVKGSGTPIFGKKPTSFLGILKDGWESIKRNAKVNYNYFRFAKKAGLRPSENMTFGQTWSGVLGEILSLF